VKVYGAWRCFDVYLNKTVRTLFSNQLWQSSSAKIGLKLLL